MTIETWGWVSTLSAVLIIYWLAGIGVGSEHEHVWVGWIIGAIPILGFVMSAVALIGRLLVTQ